MIKSWKRLKKIRQLRKEIQDLEKTYEDEICEAEKLLDQNPGPLMGVLHEMNQQTQGLRSHLRNLETKSLREKVSKMGIELPADKKFWVDGFQMRGLSELGETRLRKLVRDERLKIAKSWVEILGPITSLLVGLIGALAALFSILL